MTVQDIMQSFVLPVLTSGGVIWLFREWISARLKASIQHEYDQKLETHKASLKSQNEASLLELKNEIDQRFTWEISIKQLRHLLPRGRKRQ